MEVSKAGFFGDFGCAFLSELVFIGSGLCSPSPLPCPGVTEGFWIPLGLEL